MPHPYPGQEWKHGWKPVSAAAVLSHNHGRKPSGHKTPTGKKASPKGSAKPAAGKSAGASKAPAKPAAKPSPKAASKASPKPKAKTPTTKPKTAPKKPATASGSPGTAPPARDKKFLDQQYGQWREGLTPAQDKAMRFYQSPGFALMNGQLRGLDKKNIKADVSFNDADLARARQASKDLTAAIRKAPPLTQPMTVYRGFSADQFGNLKPGDTFTDKGFVSTSLTNDVGSVGKAAKPATAEIRLPKGAKAAAGSSREMVLPPGTKFKILSAGSKRGVPHYVMEAVL